MSEWDYLIDSVDEGKNASRGLGFSLEAGRIPRLLTLHLTVSSLDKNDTNRILVQRKCIFTDGWWKRS